MRFLFALIGFLSVIAAQGGTWQLKSGKFDVTFSDRGGSILSLKYANRDFCMPGKNSFAEKLLANTGTDGQIVENFKTLRFRKIRQDNQHIAFEAVGTGAFDWVRITKLYYFQQNSNRFSITYELTNRSDKPENAGIWIQTFLRRCEGAGLIGNTVFQPRNGKVVALEHPGAAGTDEWSLDPKADFCAVASRADRSGVVLRLPAGRVSAFYSWFLNESTLEFFLRQMTIAPGKSDRFTITGECSDDVPAAVAALEKNPPEAPRGTALFAPESFCGKRKITTSEPTSGVMPGSQKFIDATVKKQFNPSVRSVLLPVGADPGTVSVYPMENHSPVTDRPIPSTVEKVPSGRYRVLFAVPEVDPRGNFFNSVKGNEVYDAFNKKFVGYTDFPVRIALDRKPEKSFDPAIFSGGADLVHNGSFEKKDSVADGPEGFWLLNQHKYRNYWSWESSGGKNDSKYLRFEVKDPKFLGGLNVGVIPEKGRKYTASAWVFCDNPGEHWTLANVEFFDADGKELRSDRKVFENRKSYPWQKVEHVFYAPEKAVTASFRLAVLGSRTVFKVDDVKIVPEDIDLKPRSQTEALRDRLVNGHYAPLTLLEKISGETVTPHTPWFRPAAESLPEVLYLCSPGERQDDATRRIIVEFAQRLKLRFTYIPLLRKITSLYPSFGIMPPVFAPELEAYTIETLKALPAAPKVVMIAGIDFKTQTQKEFCDILAGWQRKKSGMIFVNCKNIPGELLGKPIPTTPDFFMVPEMRRLPASANDRVVQLFRNGEARVAVYNFASDRYYLAPSHFRGWPGGGGAMHPAYVSREFPFWEYLWLPGIKALRYVGGITPRIRVVGGDGKTLTVEAAAPQEAELRMRFLDGNRHVEGESVRKIALRTGSNSILLQPPQLPGGMHIVEYSISNSGGVLDSGAFRYDTPETVPIRVDFSAADRVYPFGTRPEFTVKLGEKADLEMEIEDTDGRIVAREKRPGVKEAKFSPELKAPYTLLYRVKLRSMRDGKTLSRTMTEFSVPDQPVDSRDISAVLWFIGREFSELIRELGFDYMLVSWGHDANAIGFMNALANCNIRPVAAGIGEAFGNSIAYRSDVPTDPVRKPCYSDPEIQKKAAATIRKQLAGQEYKYYDIRNYFLGDEDFLGSTVCTSEHCLRDFRKWLAKRYPSLEALNAAWKSSFASWDAVTPKQLAELSGKESLAPWLEHKVFMTEVFADRWLGGAAKYVRESFPGARLGLSGSQIPGYSYNWEALMKHIEFIAYYGGVQTRLIHDFGTPRLMSGQWSGGYAKLGVPAEGYEKGTLWMDLFRGANLMANWHGTMFSGDVTPTENMKYYSEALKELKNGVGKLFLSGSKPHAEVGVLHSQASLFAAMATFGLADWQHAQTSWDALLTDLRLNYRFVSSEELERKVPEVKLFILPAAVALSDRQVENLKKFVEQGGTLLADFGAGARDINGNLRSKGGMETLFGLPPLAPELQIRQVEIKADPEYGIPSLKGSFQVGNLKREIPATRKTGKGKAILLNLAINGYHQVAIGGVGGESDLATAGSTNFRHSAQQLIGSIAEKSGVRPFAKITDEKGKLFSGFAAIRGNEKENRILGVIRYNPVPRIDPDKTNAVKIEFNHPGHLYDVRVGKYLGHGKVIETKIPHGDAKMFAVLKDKIDGVKLSVPAELRRGEELKLNFSAGSGTQVFRVELRAPNGKVPMLYRRNVEGVGGGKASFQTAFNDTPGIWSAEVTHIASGVASKGVFTLK